MTTKATEHTPGPWHADGIRVLHRTGGKTLLLATTAQPTPGVHTDRERNFNAHLMAAAPQLLDACERVSEWIRSGECVGMPQDVIATLAFAVAAAKGR
jgi:hypothetical protein